MFGTDDLVGRLIVVSTSVCTVGLGYGTSDG